MSCSYFPYHILVPFWSSWGSKYIIKFKGFDKNIFFSLFFYKQKSAWLRDYSCGWLLYQTRPSIWADGKSPKTYFHHSYWKGEWFQCRILCNFHISVKVPKDLDGYRMPMTGWGTLVWINVREVSLWAFISLLKLFVLSFFNNGRKIWWEPLKFLIPRQHSLQPS